MGGIYLKCEVCKATIGGEQVTPAQQGIQTLFPFERRKLRDLAAERGWTYVPPDNDYCPACSPSAPLRKRHKVAELDGASLDAAVEKAVYGELIGWYPHSYSTEWENGGPLIERERISLLQYEDGSCDAIIGARWNSGELMGEKCSASGPNALIAACRAFVASKLGDEVDLP